ncbi:MAG: multidrug transporter, partial [Deltaproteobacteria bacterium HGW-Deltaproteobacteria-20]
MPVPEAWNAPAQSSLGLAEVDELGWRDAFPDPALQKLISTALHQNRSLRQVVLAMDKARAQFGIARADRIPGIDASGQNSNQRLPADLHGGIEGIDRQWNVGLGISSFELDFFGRVKNLEESALESYLATEEARRAAHISLVSQVAKGYLTLAGDREHLALARETYESRQATLELTLAQLAHGMSTELARHQVEEVVAVAQAEVARLAAQVTMDENALAVLVGVPI